MYEWTHIHTYTHTYIHRTTTVTLAAHVPPRVNKK